MCKEKEDLLDISVPEDGDNTSFESYGSDQPVMQYHMSHPSIMPILRFHSKTKDGGLLTAPAVKQWHYIT